MKIRFEILLTILALSGITLVALLVNTTPPVTKVKVISIAKAATNAKTVDEFINELLDKRSATCLRNIFIAESHMNPKAKNPNSSARGIGQLLESTYKNIGLKHSADPLAQAVATIAYISRHYGADGACAAWKHELKHHYF